MSNPTTQPDDSVPLPTEQDFDPHAGDLDAQSAWHHFGGLSVAEALAKFREDPLSYQEDFMFMGGRAFVFYFPVLDTYLREFRPTECDDSWAAIIGSGVALQMTWPTAHFLLPLHGAIRSLADYVCSHAELLATDPHEQSRIVQNWQPVYSALGSSAP